MPSAAEYFLDLVQQDQKRKQAQEKLERLLQEGVDSDSEPVTPAYWQNLLRIGVGCRFSRNMSYRLIIRDPFHGTRSNPKPTCIK